MSPMEAMAVILGMSPVADYEHAQAVVDWAHAHPEYLGNGQAQRGLQELEGMLEGGAL